MMFQEITLGITHRTSSCYRVWHGYVATFGKRGALPNLTKLLIDVIATVISYQGNNVNMQKPLSRSESVKFLVGIRNVIAIDDVCFSILSPLARPWNLH